MSLAPYFALTLTQQDIYFDQLKYPTSPLYNIGGYIRIGNLDIERLRSSHQLLVKNNDSFGIRICVRDDGVYQYISDERTLDLPLVDFSGEADSLACANEWLLSEMQTPMSLENELFRSAILKISEQEYWYLGLSHHLAVDGVGFANWASQLSDYYNGKVVKASQYHWRDVVEADQQYLQSSKYRRDASFWQAQCNKLPDKLLADHHIGQFSDVSCLPSDREILNIPSDTLYQLRNLAKELKVGLSQLFMGVFIAYFANVACRSKILLGIPAHNRKNAAQKQMIAVFTSVSPMVVELESGWSFVDLVKQLAVLQRHNYRHQSYPIGHLARDLGSDGDKLTPFDFVFNFLRLDSNLAFENNESSLVYLSHNHQPNPLMVNIWEYGQTDEAQIQFDYNFACFDRDEILGLKQRIEYLLEVIVNDANQPVINLPVMTQAELQKLYPAPIAGQIKENRCLHQLFENQVEKVPNEVAVVFAGEQVTYGQLNKRANQLAHQLINLGVVVGDRVGISVDRSVEMVIAVLATLKVGGVYVPLDPNYPLERLEFLIQDSGLARVISQSKVIERLALPQHLLVNLDEIDTQTDDSNPNVHGLNSESLGYLIYTSGSTGTPKGVEVRHRNAVALMDWVEQQFSPQEMARVLASTSLNFDLSVFEIFAPLSFGYQCWVVKDATELLTSTFDVSLINSVPSVFKEIVEQGAIPNTTLVVNLAGEPLPKSLVNDIFAVSRVARVCNCYGPSEDTTYSTWAEYNDKVQLSPTIGLPLPGTQAYVVSQQDKLLPGGQVGELLLGGAGVSRGYFNRAELTAERFVSNRFYDLPEGEDNLLYRTGDLVRIAMDGELTYMGRIDEQVKIRGFRIEPGEIERRLMAEPQVDACSVQAREDTLGHLCLVAYVKVHDCSLDEADLIAGFKTSLKSQLPAHMNPSVFMLVEHWPLTPNGKLDKKALPEINIGNSSGQYHPPQTDAEQRLVDVLASLFATDAGKISITDNFFDMGGHSLMAVKLMGEYRSQMALELPLTAIFNASDLRSLASYIASESTATKRERITPVIREGSEYPLSFAQESLWLLDCLEGGSVEYNMPLALDIVGEFNHHAAQTAINRIIERHEVLRCVYGTSSIGNSTGNNTGPMQIVREHVEFNLAFEDLRALSPVKREQKLQHLIDSQWHHVFDLSTDLLVRASYIWLEGGDDHSEQKGVLLFNLHHIAADGASAAIWIREFVSEYQAVLDNQPSSLRPLDIQYIDYVNWQRNTLVNELLAPQLDYWRKQLANVPSVHSLPLSSPRPHVKAHSGKVVCSRLPFEFNTKFDAAANYYKVTPFILIHAAMALVLSRHSNENDIVIGTPVANRSGVELEPLIGFFVNMLVLRTNCEHQHFGDFLEHVRQVNLDAQSNQEVPFEHLVELCHVARSTEHNPLVQIIMSMDTSDHSQFTLPNVTVTPRDSRVVVSKFDLELLVRADEQGLKLSWTYDDSIFNFDAIERLSEHVICVLERIVQAYEEQATYSIAHLIELPEKQSQYLINELNGEQVPYSKDVFFHQLFEAQAQCRPDHLAVYSQGQSFSYEEVNRRANRLARLLQDQGVGPDKIVGICVENNIHRPVAILAINKAGGAYVPLDPSYPISRLQYIAADSGLGHLLIEQSLFEKLDSQLNLDSQVTVNVVDSQACIDAQASFDDKNSPHVPTLKSTNLAYLIYTSGSTGRPKGVMIEHYSLLNQLYAASKIMGLNHQTRMLQTATFGFDAANWDFTLALSSGVTIYLPEKNLLLTPQELAEYVDHHQINYSFMTPSLLNVLDPSLFPTITRVSFGGEPISWDTAQAWSDGKRLFNAYGPTEATVVATMAEIVHGELLIPIGRPLQNTDVVVLDSDRQLVPYGAIGELYVGGEVLARGYINLSQQTEDSFITNLPTHDGQRMYRTGDLVRYLPDGQLLYVGRIDDQVKIRGFRIELGEIEHQLAICPSVASATVLALEISPGQKRLVAYLLPHTEQGIDDEELAIEVRSQLQSSLPDHMVPSAFVVVEQWPLTPNGKIDKKALPVPDASSYLQHYSPPRTETEKALVNIEAQLLRLSEDELSVTANFFELGGHSLLAVRLIGEISAKFGRQLSVQAVFEYPTIRSLSAQMDLSAKCDVRQSIVAVQRTSNQLPMSFAQQRLWFIDAMEGGSAQYNMPVALNLRGDFDVNAAEQALKCIIARHEPLRTVFKDTEQGPVQVIRAADDPQCQFGLTVHDLSQLADEDKANKLTKLMHQDSIQVFDLTKDLMIRASFVAMKDAHGVLIFNMHHIASDGWSMAVLVKEFIEHYQGVHNAKPSNLADLTIQYADYGHWQSSWMAGDLKDRQLNYWQKQLEEVPPVHSLPLDRPRGKAGVGVAGLVKGDIPKALAEQLNQLAHEHEVTLFMLLHGALAWVLSRHSHTNDIVIGTVVANRPQPELEPLIGFFVNTLVLRADTGHDQLDAYLQHIKKINLDAQSYQDVPFEHLVEHAKVSRSQHYAPLFQILFSMNTNELGELTLPGLDISVIEDSYQHLPAKFDLDISARQHDDGIQLQWVYDKSLFDHSSVARLCEHMCRVLASMVNLGHGSLSQLTMLSELEQDYLLEQLNQTEVSRRSDLLMHQRFEQCVANTPDQIAIIFGDVQLSYHQLNQQANRLAHQLRANGVTNETLVGIYCQRSPQMVVAILAVLKAGGAYVPLDPEHPLSRLAHVLQDSHLSHLISFNTDTSELSLPESCHIVALESAAWLAHSETLPSDNLPLLAGQGLSSMAYIIYTSGSTGKPKGVVIEHRSLVALIEWAQDFYSPEQLSTVLASTSLNFDLSVFELLVTLSSRGSVVVVHNILSLLEPAHQQYPLTLVNTVPSGITALHDGGALPEQASVINLAGEPLKQSLVASLQQQLPNTVIVNLYGPSEDTTYSTVKAYTQPISEAVTIGRPINNTRAYVFDKSGGLVPFGCVGELYLAGEGLSRGYLNKPELTASQFVDNPYKPGERLYRTGDLVRYLTDGDLDYQGRVDDQVKIRGFRIELGEIEHHLNAFDGIEASLVLARDNGTAGLQLVAYGVVKSVAEAQNQALERNLRAYLQGRLPDYMVPAAVVFVESWPLTPNGKINKKALPNPSAEAFGQQYEAPCNATQKSLVVIEAALLKLPEGNISINANFFELGGHSLLAVKLVTAIAQQFNRELSIKEVFEYPTIASLAQRIDSTEQSESISVILPQAQPNLPQPLSFAQKRLWFIDRMDGASAQYNLPVAVEVSGQFDSDIAERALTNIIERHHILRTVYAQQDDEPIQQLLQNFEFRLQRIDWQQLDSETQTRRLHDLRLTDATTPFDLTTDLMVRASYVRLADSRGILLLNMHHIASDGWSIGVLVEAFVSQYRQLQIDSTAQLAELDIQYADFALWQNQWLASESLQGQLDYWQEQLTDVPQLHGLMLDYPRREHSQPIADTVSVTLPMSVAQQLRQVATTHNATLFMVLHSALSLVLSRHSNTPDIVIGTPVANRRQSQLAPLIGFFVNTLVLRTDNSYRNFPELLAHVRLVNLAAQAHQDVPFEHLVEHCGISRSTLYEPLFQIMFSLNNNELGELQLPGVKLNPLPDLNDGAVAKFDLDISVVESDQGLQLSWQYNTSLFNRERIERLSVHWSRLLQSIAHNPNADITELVMLTELELHSLGLDACPRLPSATVSSMAHSSIVHSSIAQRFEMFAADFPSRSALVHSDQTLSFAQLNDSANRLAHYLIEKGVTKGTLVGLCVERSFDGIIGLLAIIKAGGVYVPIDPDYPVARRRYILSDTGLVHLLSQTGLTDELELSQDHTLILLDSAAHLAHMNDYSGLNPQLEFKPELAYIIYTSGSTGRPKGVMISHQNVLSYQKATIDVEDAPFALMHDRRVMQFSSISFDIFVEELSLSILSGHTLVLPDGQSLVSSEDFWQRINEQRINVVSLPTAYWHQLCSDQRLAQQTLNTPLKLLITGGEAMSANQLARWQQLVSDDIRLLNTYGPTEATVIATAFDCAQMRPEYPSVPIGQVLDNAALLILDEQLMPVPDGAVGELYIAGLGVAAGYFNQADLTERQFVTNPFNDSGQVLYRTGDLVCRVPNDHNLLFIGRVDNQVKIRGFRIEPGELESCLASHTKVDEVVVLTPTIAESLHLVAYVTAVDDNDGPEFEQSLFDWVRRQLPHYLWPSAIIVLEEFPLTVNGKLDKRALPEPDLGSSSVDIPLEGKTEQLLGQLWQSLLDVQTVGANSQFFELGGHSLLAVRMVSEVARKMAVEVPLRSIFEYPVLRDLAEHIDSLSNFASAPIEPVARGERVDFELSFAQQRIWTVLQIDSGAAQYNMPAWIEVNGPIDRERLASAFALISQRHEVLRTTYHQVQGQTWQRVHPQLPVPLELCDWQDIKDDKSEQQQRLLAQGRQLFDLTEQAPIRCHLNKLADGRHLMVLTVHHIAADGWSLGALSRQLIDAYVNYEDHNDSNDPVKLQYVDYAAWQNKLFKSDEYTRQLNYWQKQLVDVPQFHSLPLDFHRDQIQDLSGADIHRHIDEQQYLGLKRLALLHNVSLFMVMDTLFALTLQIFSNEQDIVIGTPVSGRERGELEALFGCFINVLPLRHQVDPSLSFASQLRANKGMILDAFSHQSVSFEHIINEIAPYRALDHAPLVQVMMVFENQSMIEADCGDVQFNALKMSSGLTKYDLQLFVEQQQDGIGIRWQYASSLFKPQTVSRMASTFELLLEGVLSDANKPQGSLLMLDAKQQQQIDRLNSTARSYLDERCVHLQFEQHANEQGDKVAIVGEKQTISYAQLNQQVNRLAHYLIAKGFGRGDRVAVYLPRSIELFISLLACVKAGVSYVPLEIQNKSSRLTAICKEADVVAVLTNIEFIAKCPQVGLWQLPVDEALAEGGCLTQMDTHNPTPLGGAVAVDDSVYVIYTSGSTGVPKGVDISHRGLIDYCDHVARQFYQPQLSGSLMITSHGFDLAVPSIYLPLIKGDTVTLGSNGTLQEIAQQLADADSQSHWFVRATPTHMKALLALLPVQKLTNQHVFLIGGEAFEGSVAQQLQDRCPNSQIFNQYGPTEAVVGCTSFDVSAYGQSLPAVIWLGQANSNTRLYVLNEQLQQVPFGVTGQLYVSGPCLAKGYVNQPGLTAQKFVSNPYYEPSIDSHYQRMYATGDLVRWCDNQQLAFVGRVDNQLKLRGHRIEPGEIVHVLVDNQEVVKAEVLLDIDEQNQQRLVGYIETSENIWNDKTQQQLIADLNQSLKTTLPPYMVPDALVVIEHWPMTANGKLNHKALPKPQYNILPATAIVEPQTPTQFKLREIWSQLLAIDEQTISCQTSYFEIGGHSLLVIRLIAQIRHHFGCELSMQTLFAHNDIIAQAAQIELAESVSALPQVSAYEHDGRNLPLSFAQQRLWVIDALEGGSTQYNMPIALEVVGQFDTQVAQNALNTIIERHQVLRTVYTSTDDGPLQNIQQRVNFELKLADLTHVSNQTQQQQQLQLEIEQMFNQVFDLSSDLMVKAKYVLLADTPNRRGVLLFNMHHIAFDGWSRGVLIEEFMALYQAGVMGEVNPLPPLSLQYADYALWQRQYLQGDVLDEQLEYWRHCLDDVPVVHALPLDRVRPAQKGHRGGAVQGQLGIETTRCLQQLANDLKVTPFMLIHGALALVLSRHSNTHDIVIGTAVANRMQLELEPLMGFFVNTLVLRTNTDFNNMADYLDHIKQVNLDAQANQDVPFELLVEHCKVVRDASHTPLVQIMLSMNNNSSSQLSLPDLTFKPLEQHDEVVKFDLDIGVKLDEQGLELLWMYDADLFDAKRIEQLDLHLRNVLKAMAQSDKDQLSQSMVHQLPMIEPSALAKLQAIGERQWQPFADKQSIAQLFELQASQSPDKIAIYCKEQSLSYLELNQQANQLANLLLQLGLVEGDCLGICLARTPEMIITALAAAKLGAVYVPFDPNAPLAHQQIMVSETQLQWVVSCEELAPELKDTQVLLWSQLQMAQHHTDNLPITQTIGADAPVYINFTSGSTGKPKGVVVPHLAVCRLVNGADWLPLNQDTVLLQMANFAFDAATFEIWGALLSGGTVVQYPEPLIDLSQVNLCIDQFDVNTLFMTSGLFEQWSMQLPEDGSSVRYVLSGGEVVSPRAVERLYARYSQLTYINAYGPTENTTYSTCYTVPREHDWHQPLPIGYPINGTRAYVLDKHKQLVPEGSIGELYLGGAGVAIGYLNQELLTQQMFTPSEWIEGDRLYRTGDLVRWRSDGALDFVDRADNQIKLRGFRVELGDIETALDNHELVGESLVLVAGSGADKYLVAYICPAYQNSDCQQDLSEQLKQALKQRLPAHMVPRGFVVLDKFPLNANGKVDKKKLPQPTFVSEQSYVAPRDEVEQQLAQIWQSLLKLDSPVGIEDNFFDLGGHSILLSQLKIRVETQFNLKLPIVTFFNHQSVSALAAVINLKLQEIKTKNEILESSDDMEFGEF